jgi:hypothetical protein
MMLADATGAYQAAPLLLLRDAFPIASTIPFPEIP